MGQFACNGRLKKIEYFNTMVLLFQEDLSTCILWILMVNKWAGF